jgi:hypothetical protein
MYLINPDVIFRCEKYTSYTHEISASGGYISATITIPMNVLDAEVWYDKGIGRRVKVLDHAGNVIWNGFVNTIEVTGGASTLSVGPLSGIANLVGAKYSPVDWDNGTVGSETDSTLVQDYNSTSLYGKWEKWLSVGQAEEAAAETVRNTYLADMAYPYTSDDLSIYSANTPVVTLGCVGNLYWLMAYTYNNLSEGVDTLSNKLCLVLDADPNSVISHDYSYIEPNSYLVGINELGNRYAWDIIKELLSIGNDTDDSRRMFGVYDDGIVKYSRMPDVVEYYHYLGDRSRKITTSDGGIVPPWEVVPGKWLQVPDFLLGTSMTSLHFMKDDKRNKFLESVRYTSPNGLDLSGRRNDKLSQMLAKIAYSGGML